MDRISIESLNIKGVYSIKDGDITDNKCSLCRNSLLIPSIENINKKKINISITKGICNHLFHTDCIKAHLKNSLSCPIDNTLWKQDNNFMLYANK